MSLVMRPGAAIAQPVLLPAGSFGGRCGHSRWERREAVRYAAAVFISSTSLESTALASPYSMVFLGS